MPVTRQDYGKALVAKLDELEVRAGYRYRGSIRLVDAFVCVMAGEGTRARWNPLATTYDLLPGSTPLAGNTAGVQEYDSFERGVEATARTLLGLGSTGTDPYPPAAARYALVCQALRNRWLPVTVCLRWKATEWGTFHGMSEDQVRAHVAGVELRWTEEAWKLVPA